MLKQNLEGGGAVDRVEGAGSGSRDGMPGRWLVPEDQLGVMV